MLFGGVWMTLAGAWMTPAPQLSLGVAANSESDTKLVKIRE
jgi:hypothetical protein